jgi:toxin-antitoxin system PIN domain toxin
MFLLDINVWLALAFRGHAHHLIAKRWFEQVAPGGAALCRFTQQGFLRLSTDRKVVRQKAVTLARAWEIYDAFLDDPRVVFSEEPDGIEVHWRAFTSRRSRSPHLWNDAYLAAFARAASFELVTFDKAFTQYRKLSCTILS